MERCFPYMLVDHLKASGDSGIEKLPPSTHYETIASLIAGAQGQGFDGMGNLENYCRLALEYGANFYSKPPFARVLREMTFEHVHEVIARLTVTDWAEMKEIS